MGGEAEVGFAFAVSRGRGERLLWTDLTDVRGWRRGDCTCTRQIGFGLMVAVAFLVTLGMLAWAASAATGKVGDLLDSRKKKRAEALTVEQQQKLVTAHSQSFHDYGAINEAHKSVETQVTRCFNTLTDAYQRILSALSDRLQVLSGTHTLLHSPYVQDQHQKVVSAAKADYLHKPRSDGLGMYFRL